MSHAYKTIGADLVEHAEAAVTYFVSHGYRVRREVYSTDFPYTATIQGKRGHTRVLVEVDARVRLPRLELWSRYAQSCSEDTRIAVVVPLAALRVPLEDKVRELKLGLYTSSGGRLTVRSTPRDLALRATLPELTSLSPKLRKLFGSAFEKFEGEDWREGFDEAAQVVETGARRYLKEGIASGRLLVLNRKGNQRSLSPHRIDGMTMGQLKDAFEHIQTMNQRDSIIYEVLAKVNPARIDVVHRRATRAAERRLRRSVGQHMWRLVTAMRAVSGEAP